MRGKKATRSSICNKSPFFIKHLKHRSYVPKVTNSVIINHQWPLSTANVANATEELNKLNFYVILIKYFN